MRVSSRPSGHRDARSRRNVLPVRYRKGPAPQSARYRCRIEASWRHSRIDPKGGCGMNLFVGLDVSLEKTDLRDQRAWQDREGRAGGQ